MILGVLLKRSRKSPNQRSVSRFRAAGRVDLSAFMARAALVGLAAACACCSRTEPDAMRWVNCPANASCREQFTVRNVEYVLYCSELRPDLVDDRTVWRGRHGDTPTEAFRVTSTDSQILLAVSPASAVGCVEHRNTWRPAFALDTSPEMIKSIMCNVLVDSEAKSAACR
jgi:hypothetical protein